MPVSSCRRVKVNLSDYDYVRDIESRSLLALLSPFEIEVMKEVIDASLSFSILEISETLEADEADVIRALDKLEQTGLLKRTKNKVEVNKEVRKYYKTHVNQFRRNFKPDLNFLQCLLNKVPLPVIPQWYGITKFSENLYYSIYEKQLLTPKMFERHVFEISQEDELLGKIIEDVFSAPDLEVSSEHIKEKYSLTPVQFGELLLYLEFNIVCCRSYRKQGNHWIEVVQPFQEWVDYQRILRKNHPKTIDDPAKIERKHPQEFGFILDLGKIIRSCPIPFKEFHKITGMNQGYAEDLLAALLGLNLVHKIGLFVESTSEGVEWAKNPLHEQAMSLYRHPSTRRKAPRSMSDRDLGEIERGMRNILHSGWIYLEDFQKSFISPIGRAEAPTLKNNGRSWCYELPTYSDEEYCMIEDAIFESLFSTGMVATGTHKGKKCFCVTPFGKMMLAE